MMSQAVTISILMTIVGAATPLLLAALGELVAEKSGVLNLGVEGMMLIGAVTAFAVTKTTGQPLARPRRGDGGRDRRLDDLRLPDADPRLEPGGDRPRADDLRHRPLAR